MEPQWLPIGHQIRIAVSAEHRFGTDAVLLAYFSRPTIGEQVCDLGTGCGILPFLWIRDGIAATITGVELQKEAVALALQSVAVNCWSDRVTFHNADLREWASTRPASFDRVTCNPPYFPSGSGRHARSAAARYARYEGYGCTFEEVCLAAKMLLMDDGRFYFCHRPEQQPRLFATLTTHGFTPVRAVTVCQQADKPPFLLLIEAQKAENAPLKTAKWCLSEGGQPSPLYRQIYAPILEEHTV